MSGGLTSRQRSALHRLSLGPVVATVRNPQYAALERRCLAHGEEGPGDGWRYWTITQAGRQALQAGQ
jgi:hypothetical protein